MENEIISVVVPVYKVEKYLDKCIESILNQTYSALEIILVDDGSPDRCGIICDAYARRDARIKVIHQANAGLSAARNAGIEAAAGDYIGFVDSDDYIHPEMYARLLRSMKDSKAEISLCSYERVDECGNVIAQESPIKDEYLTPTEAIWKLVRGKWIYYVIACNKLYRRELFQTIRFAEGKQHEDIFAAHELFYHCTGVSTIKDRLYSYVQREGSILTSEKSIRSLDALEAMCLRSAFFNEHGLNALQDEAMRILLKRYAGVRFNVPITSQQDRDRVREIDRMVRDTYNRSGVRKTVKGRLLVSAPGVYRIMKAVRRHRRG